MMYESFLYEYVTIQNKGLESTVLLHMHLEKLTEYRTSYNTYQSSQSLTF